VLIGGAALLTAAPVSLHWSQNTVAISLDSADARIGRYATIAHAPQPAMRSPNVEPELMPSAGDAERPMPDARGWE
jgi:hypothetical protein